MIKKTLFIVLLFSLNAALLFAEDIEDFVYDSKGKRDPFISLITRDVRVAAGLEGVQVIDDITLEGILWDPKGGSIAVLNGVIMREGQEAGSVKLKKIEEKKITLLLNEIEYTISLVKKGAE